MVAPVRLFLESRYQKFARDLPQTRFYCPRCKGHRRRREDCKTCDGRGKLSDDSVEELLSRRLLPALKAKRGTFHGAGREDIDVRMLGRGRPFVFEVIGVRRPDIDLDALLDRFHETAGDRVRIDPFRIVDRSRVGELKESKFRKLYRVGIQTEAADAASMLEGRIGESVRLEQRTPQRVVHRRKDLVRERDVTVCAVRRADEDGMLEIDLETEHGTYVKEFVSGDDERTTPSIAEWLGAQAECARLDVLEILDDVETISPTDGG
ncbi:MAG: tRNA pseudouridine(54/55) synthase Pus10 [Planctomycetota bacterium]